MPTSGGDPEQPVGCLMKTSITLVTGCSTGIGRALAEEFHRRGHVVYATVRRVSTLSELEARGIRTATLDVTDQRVSATCKRVFNTMVSPWRS